MMIYLIFFLVFVGFTCWLVSNRLDISVFLQDSECSVVSKNRRIIFRNAFMIVLFSGFATWLIGEISGMTPDKYALSFLSICVTLMLPTASEYFKSLKSN